MKKFYLYDGQAQQGPYDLEELKQKNISPQTPVWFSDLENWTPAGQVEELKNLFTHNPPPYNNTFPGQYDGPVPYQPPEGKHIDRKPWIIGLSIACIIFISIIFSTNNRNIKKEQPPLTDTATITDPDKARLMELEEKERQRQAINDAQAIIDMEYRNNWRKYIKSSTNKFKVGFLGGINNLEITVTNNTDRIVDEVVVQINYIKENGGLWETKEVLINNIQPGTKKSEKAPDSNRGTKIVTTISRITARSISLCFDTNKERERKSIHPEDPWLCR